MDLEMHEKVEGLDVVFGDATCGQHLSQQLEIPCEFAVVALDGAKVVEAVLVLGPMRTLTVTLGVWAAGIESLGEPLAVGEQELLHDTVDDDVAGPNAAVFVMLEGEVEVKRVLAGTRLLFVVGRLEWSHFEAEDGGFLLPGWWRKHRQSIKACDAVET